MTTEIRAAGYCPMGCGQTLVAHWGTFTPAVLHCTGRTCPRPTAAGEILLDGETDHIVMIDNDGHTIRHPLRERLDDTLLTCDLHNIIARGGMSELRGRYRVIANPAGYAWDRIDGDIP